MKPGKCVYSDWGGCSVDLTNKVISQPRPEGNACIWEGRRNSNVGTTAGAE